MEPPGFDSYALLDFVSAQVMRAWARREPARSAVWARLARPLGEARVALVSSAGVALAGDRPFDEEGERRNPWWGDPSYRVIPRGTTAAEVRFHHLHVDAANAARDLDVVLPLARLDELVAAGEVGSAAGSHYSIMGYQLDATELVEATGPELAARMRAEAVDAALLVPV